MKKIGLCMLIIAITAVMSSQAWAQPRHSLIPEGAAAKAKAEHRAKLEEKIAVAEANYEMLEKQLQAAQEKAGILTDPAVVDLAAKVKTAQDAYDAQVAQLTAAGATPEAIAKDKKADQLARALIKAQTVYKAQIGRLSTKNADTRELYIKAAKQEKSLENMRAELGKSTPTPESKPAE